MKLGIVGTGLIVRMDLPVLKDSCWTPSAICCTERSKEKANALAADYYIPAVYTDFDQMLSEADMDAVYIGIPNSLHYSFARQALDAGYHVIVEKPMTSNSREAEALAALAKEKHLFLFEAITTLYSPVYEAVRTWLPRIGTLKLTLCNYSQYSSRYDAFLSGKTAPVFDPAQSGGALMDLNLYNIYFVTGLFGPPASVSYLANIDRGIDTSGILTLDYGTHKAVCAAAKDCGAPGRCTIQGTKGYITLDSSSSICHSALLHLNDGTEEFLENPPACDRMLPEFQVFGREIASGNQKRCYETLELSLLVSRIMTEARHTAGLRFPADDQ